MTVGTKTKVLIGVLIATLMFLGPAIIQFSDRAKIDVEPTYTNFNVKEGSYWYLAGKETNQLYNGSTLIKPLATAPLISTHVVPNHSINVIRETYYPNGVVVRDHYFMEGDGTPAIEKFPVSHTVEIINGKGLIYQYSASKLKYDGDTVKNVQSPQSFGHNMKLTWDNRSYWNTLYGGTTDTLKAKWKVNDDHYLVSVRLFDPTQSAYWTCDFSSTSCGWDLAPTSGELVVTATTTLNWNASIFTWSNFSAKVYCPTGGNGNKIHIANSATDWLLDGTTWKNEPSYSIGFSTNVNLDAWDQVNIVTNHTSNLSQVCVDGSCSSTGAFAISKTTNTSQIETTYAGGDCKYDNMTFYVMTSEIPSAPDTTPPVISGIGVSASTTSATITWTTDESANESIKWGTTTALSGGSNGSATLGTSHSRTASGLSSATLYYYNVTSCDAAGNCRTNGTFNFTTATPGVGCTLLHNYDFIGGDQGWSGYDSIDSVAGWIAHTDTGGTINSPDESLSSYGNVKVIITENPKNSTNAKICLDSAQYSCSDAHVYFEDYGDGAHYNLKFWSASAGYKDIKVDGTPPMDTNYVWNFTINNDANTVNGDVSWGSGSATFGPYSISSTHYNYITVIAGTRVTTYEKVEAMSTYSCTGVTPPTYGNLLVIARNATQMNFTQNANNIYSVNVTCNGTAGAQCGYVKVYLDPISTITGSDPGAPAGARTLQQNHQDLINGWQTHNQKRILTANSDSQSILVVPWYGKVGAQGGDYCAADNLHTDCGAQGTDNDFCMVSDEHSGYVLGVSMSRDSTLVNAQAQAIYNTVTRMNASTATGYDCGGTTCNFGRNTKWIWRVTYNAGTAKWDFSPTAHDSATDADSRYIIAFYNFANNPVLTDSTLKANFRSYANSWCADYRNWAYVYAPSTSKVDGTSEVDYYFVGAASQSRNDYEGHTYWGSSFPGYYGDAAMVMLACSENAATSAADKTLYRKYVNDTIEQYMMAASWTTGTGLKIPDGTKGHWTGVTHSVSDQPSYACQADCPGGMTADGARAVKLCTASYFAKEQTPSWTPNSHITEFCGEWAAAPSHTSTTCPQFWNTGGGALSPVQAGYKNNGLCGFIDIGADETNWETRIRCQMEGSSNGYSCGTGWSFSQQRFPESNGLNVNPCFGIYWGEFMVDTMGYALGYADITFNATGGVAAVCGNGIIEAGETCDDGNTYNGDGCSATCQIESVIPVCGNGVVETGESCDDGNLVSGDGCSGTCQVEYGEPGYSANGTTKTGLVSITPGYMPFWTTINPHNWTTSTCLANMTAGQSCLVNFTTVNATGTVGSSHWFFAYARSNLSQVTQARENDTHNVTIRDRTAPSITGYWTTGVTSSAFTMWFNFSESANNSIKIGNTSALSQWYGNNPAFQTTQGWSTSGAQANMTYYANITVCDVYSNCATYGWTMYNVTTLPQATGVNITIDNLNASTLRAELGGNYSVIARSLNPTAGICVDVIYTGYTTDYSCGTGSTAFNFSLDHFTKTTFSGGQSAVNLTYGAGGGSGTFNVTVHKRDDIDSVTVNVTGFTSGGTYPKDVKFYINGSLSNSIGLIMSSSSNTLNSFSDGASSVRYNFVVLNSVTTMGNLYLPKGATVTAARFNLKAGYAETVQSAPDAYAFSSDTAGGYVFANYTRPSTAVNTSKWRYTMDIGPGSTLTYYHDFNTAYSNPCWKSTLETRLTSKINRVTGQNTYPGYEGTDQYGSGQDKACKGTSWLSFNEGGMDYPNGVSCDQTPPFNRLCTESTLGDGAEQRAMDGDYNTGVWYDLYAGGWSAQGSQRTVDQGGTAGCCWFGIGTIYGEEMIWNMTPVDPWMEVGTITGTRDWSYSGGFTTTATTSDMSTKLTNFLATCTEDSTGFCTVPVYMYSDGGQMNISSIEVNYTYDPNPVTLDTDLIAAQLRGQADGFYNLSVTVTSSQQGILQIGSLRYAYAGGNDSVIFRAHNGDYTKNATQNVTFYYSKWNMSYPPAVDYLEFIPKTPTSKNITPYGQATSYPVFNITNAGYGGLAGGFDLSMRINESDSCVNITVHDNSSKVTGQLLNTSWQTILDNVTSSQGIWMWADFGCNSTSWRLWEPDMSLRACANGAELCSQQVS